MPFSKLFPVPSEDIDPVGQNLRDLDRTVTALQFTDPIRLYGDKSIIDGNLTTFFTALVLYAIGTDQVRGFGATLILGNLTSMFTAIFCARVVFDMAERTRSDSDDRLSAAEANLGDWLEVKSRASFVPHSSLAFNNS